MRKMRDQYYALCEQVRSILWREWDPIGLSNELCSDDSEYDEYCRFLMQRLKKGADRDSVFDYLVTVISEGMGLCVDDDLTVRTMAVSEKLICLQPDIQKYAALAEEERKRYPEEEVKRRKLLENKMEEYLRLAEMDGK